MIIFGKRRGTNSRVDFRIEGGAKLSASDVLRKEQHRLLIEASFGTSLSQFFEIADSSSSGNDEGAR